MQIISTDVSKRIRELRGADEIRILVLVSLALQTILIFFSLFRKRDPNKLLGFLLWSSYLGADYVATMALGRLLTGQNEASDQHRTTGDLIAFWAPFLLHLGGPDTINSYSLEDNELWLRHLLGLTWHIPIDILAFIQSRSSPHLWRPAIFVFACGIFKYGERTLSLRSASMDHLQESMLPKPDPGPYNFLIDGAG